jgi:hypothetical protein
VGSGRSGTTLVQSIFDSHPRLAVTHEAHFVVPMARRRWLYETGGGVDTQRFVGDLYRDLKFRSLGLPRKDVFDAIARAADFADACRAVFAVFASTRGKELYGDKTPHFVKHIPLLARLFPETRFVHVVRDGRDAALAFRQRDFGPRSVVDAALYWKRNVERGQAAGRRLGPDRYTEVRYEDLVSEPEPTVRAVCAFLGLEFQAEMLRYYERADAILSTLTHPTIHENLRLPLTFGLRDWRRTMTTHESQLFAAAAGGTLRRAGYEVPHVDPSIRVRLEVAWHWIGWQRQRLAAALRNARHALRRLRGSATEGES